MSDAIGAICLTIVVIAAMGFGRSCRMADAEVEKVRLEKGCQPCPSVECQKVVR